MSMCARLLVLSCCASAMGFSGQKRGAGPPAHVASVADIAVNPLILTDFPQPPLNPADYQPYLGRGTGRITAQLVATLRNGRRVAATAKTKAYVYPDTPYTAWLLAQFARLADGRSNFTLTEPGLSDFPVAVPKYLLGVDNSHVNEDQGLRAARYADSCSPQGFCEFTGLKPGKYLVFAIAYETIMISHKNEDLTYTYDPNADRYDQHKQVTTLPPSETATGAYVLLLHGHLNVTDGSHLYALPPKIQPAAHFSLF